MGIKFRKEPSGPEAEFVKKFLSEKYHLLSGDLEYQVLTEVVADSCIPDIIIVGYAKGLKAKWHPERDNLTKTDLKVLHNIYQSGARGITIDRLKHSLGFKNLNKSLFRLQTSKLVCESNGRMRMSDADNAFFIKQIIAIEAKLKNWKDAIGQAQLNENFSSHSYVLLPENIVNNNVKSVFDSSIGLISFNNRKVKFKKKARKNKIPSSYFSWALNEYLGKNMFSALEV